MRLLAPTADLAQWLSNFIMKGGWIAAPLGGALLLYLLQDKLVFNPVRTPPAALCAGPSDCMRAVTLTMADNVSLHGWWTRPDGAASGIQPAAIYFGGRSEEVSWVSEQLSALRGMHALCINYRGYGCSQGKPTEDGIFADALQLYDWVSAQPGVDAERIAVIGRSLGSGVAAYLAAQRPAAAAVLITPYDSMVEIARRRFPYCAANLLLRHRFESVRFARQAKAPVLVLLAQSDEVVPLEHALRLIAAWSGGKQVETVDGTDHCDIQLHGQTWRAVGEFLRKHLFPT